MGFPAFTLQHFRPYLKAYENCSSWHGLGKQGRSMLRPYKRVTIHYRAYRAEETEVPAAAKTGDISAWAKERKDLTTTGSNWVPLASLRRRTASS
jgi:hypothetical protein